MLEKEIPVYHPHTKKQIGAIVTNGKYQTISRTGPKTSPKDSAYDDSEELGSPPGGPEGLAHATAHIIATHDKNEAHEAKVASLIAAAKKKKVNEGLDEELSDDEMLAITEQAIAELNESEHVGYHVSGKVTTHGDQTKQFKIKFADHPSKTDIANQNKHLEPHEVEAIQSHIDDHADDDMTDTRSLQKAGDKNHHVVIHSNKPVFKESEESEASMKTIDENIEAFIAAANNEDPIAAQDAFSTLMAAKVSALIDAKRVDVGQGMFK